MKEGNSSQLQKAFDALESVMGKIDKVSKDKIAVGLLESLQNQLLNSGVELDSVEKVIGENTIKEWNDIKDYWNPRQTK